VTWTKIGTISSGGENAGKKFTIEIPDDKIGDFIGNTHFLMPYMMAGHIGHHDTGLPIEPYTVPDLEQIRTDAYDDGYKAGREAERARQPDLARVRLEAEQLGMVLAWEAARKIWKYDTTTLKAIFGEGIMRMDWFMNFTAAEAIEKLKAYEQKQDVEIRVGDEVGYYGVADEHGIVCYSGVVLEIKEDDYLVMEKNGKTYALEKKTCNN